MKINYRVIVFFVGAFFLLSGCSNTPFYHNSMMRGQVVNADERKVVVCVGETSGLKGGEIFSVFRSKFDADLSNDGESGYTLENVGKIRISKIRDKHYADVIVLEGQVSVNDIVQLDATW